MHALPDQLKELIEIADFSEVFGDIDEEFTCSADTALIVWPEVVWSHDLAESYQET